ncbi:MAG: hypothetical protein U9N36_09895 [Euryarchaeota archaeon]|nr:hypothetical protein [Euryarchaeota archaeon]
MVQEGNEDNADLHLAGVAMSGSAIGLSLTVLGHRTATLAASASMWSGYDGGCNAWRAAAGGCGVAGD